MEKRRDFLKWTYRAFMGLWSIGILGVLFSYLRAPRSASSVNLNWIDAGKLSDIRPGSGRLISHAAKPLWVLKLNNNQVVSLSAVCTHMQCIIKWDETRKMLVCPCHQGEFDADGNVIAGIPSRPLTTYKIEIRGDEIYVIL
jgi:nitrite reductase/ring-hydroxylating ferredoxin subunit